MTILKIRINWIWVSFEYLFFCVEDLICFFCVGVNVNVYVVSCGCFVCVFCVDFFFFNLLQI
jgi:hypothetical protein